MITKELFKYLEDLKNYNNREWFNANKATYLEHHGTSKAVFKSIEEQLQKQDNIASHKLMRIYRDIRFSKDKTPFKPRFAGGFERATPALRGGYYLNIEPGGSMAGGGFYGPNTDDLKRIRQEFEMDDSEIRTILSDKTFKAAFGTLLGDELKTAPRGFDPNHKAIDLIRKKQFYVIHRFTDEEVLAPDFEEKVVTVYKAILPFFNYMSSVLTTNSNGESTL